MAQGKKEAPAGRVVLGKHRVSYLHIKEASAFDDSAEPKYDATFLIPKDHPDVDKIMTALEGAYEEAKVSKFNNLPFNSPKLWNPLRDGDEWLDEHPEALEYEGVYFLKASSKSQPAVFGPDGQDIIDLDEVYSGCYCRGVIGVYSFNKNGKRGFGFFLNSLKKMEDGERLGGFSASHDDYEDEAPARPTRNAPPARSTPSRPAAAAPARPAAPARQWDHDADGNDIYSDDNGANWYYPA